ncbi:MULTISPECIES: YidC/Oxa1 family membrane protein insertase [Clostridium]|jgi:YidC/Oxa1 family membrane protein insertase|uniref:Membrane protein insertase YidC n=3 Tax=Clostridium TaxID=1485 RepID=D8GMU5_CLOLD|nr:MULTISPECIES: membrane protein insertase YidC [Clostridium]ADK15733.1 putative membrane protein [Clostridium ljungdahlii DSM 13528]AGY74985.1 membrane protein insertase YidC [Clostridium autoethanogenum DSM 10061]ALU35159.1 Membrane protein insertase YidC/Oxa1 family [Clostridium autoethanogenum DSM 10061]OAA86620.1 Membrane protein insertase YidC [Clostridium ljungdahlii DSM 13528]OVY49340.1 Membrane protein insertase YidC [Clostridium autoethanogenum]
MNIIFNLLGALLNHVFNFTGDWGIAVVVLTLIVKVLLMPMSMKQRFSILKQQKVAKKMEDIKIRYKNDKLKMEKEIQNCYKDNLKSMMGCLLTIIQLPIIGGLYKTIINMPVVSGTVLIPWVASIKLSDSYFIVPIMYSIISMLPGLVNSIDYFKVYREVQYNKMSAILPGVIGLLITIKAPIALGLYFITSSVFSLVEEIAFRIYIKNKQFV